MVRIAAVRVSKHHGSQLVLNNVSVELHSFSRLGIVGRNGTGKSTLLRILAGLEAPDSGGLTRDPPSLEVGLITQEHDALPHETVMSYLLRRTGLGPVATRMDALEGRMKEDLTAIEPYTETVERFRALGGGDIDARAAEMCDSLHLPADLDFEMSALSGGQRARAALASMLLARFDLFLLDEPTNDLDFEGLSRLEDWIGGLKGGVAVVSHDRYFLDRMVEDILELDEHSHTATASPEGSPTTERSQSFAVPSSAELMTATSRNAPGCNSASEGRGAGRRKGHAGLGTQTNRTRTSVSARLRERRTSPRRQAPWSGASTNSKPWRSRGRAGTSTSRSRREGAAETSLCASKERF